MTLTGNNVITLRKLTSKVTTEKGIPLKGPFIVYSNCIAVPIYRLLSVASHRSFTAFQVKINLTFMRHRNALTSQFLCRRVQCCNATQLRRGMNGP